jgi:hypothetical protein
MHARIVMGCSFEFDQVHNVFRYSWEGNLTDEVLTEGDATGRRLLAARPPCKGILDFSKVTKVDASSSKIKGIATKPPAYEPDQTVVLVAPKDVVYGLTRMFVTLGEKKRPAMYVVRTIEEAYHLLGIDSPQFSPISVPRTGENPVTHNPVHPLFADPANRGA